MSLKELIKLKRSYLQHKSYSGCKTHRHKAHRKEDEGERPPLIHHQVYGGIIICLISADVIQDGVTSVDVGFS